MRDLFRWIWRALNRRCQECGGRSDSTLGYEVDHCAREGTVFEYCNTCGFYCRCIRKA